MNPTAAAFERAGSASPSAATRDPAPPAPDAHFTALAALREAHARLAPAAPGGRSSGAGGAFFPPAPRLDVRAAASPPPRHAPAPTSSCASRGFFAAATAPGAARPAAAPSGPPFLGTPFLGASKSQSQSAPTSPFVPPSLAPAPARDAAPFFAAARAQGQGLWSPSPMPDDASNARSANAGAGAGPSSPSSPLLLESGFESGPGRRAASLDEAAAVGGGFFPRTPPSPSTPPHRHHRAPGGLGLAFFAGGVVANANARCVSQGACQRANVPACQGASPRHASAPASPRGLLCFEVAARSSPHQQHSLYKTELCRSWEETGHCRYGHKCQFAHGRDELRPVLRHPKYKTEVCRTFAHGGECPYGTRCRFIHVRVPHESVLGVLEAGAHNVIPADWAPEQGGSAEREGALAGRAEAAARRGERGAAGVFAFAGNANGSNGSSGANANNNAPPREVRRARRLPVFREIAGEGEKADGDGDDDDVASAVRAARTRRTAAAYDVGESAALFGGVLAG